MNKATLTSPDGKFKTIVDVGSNQASVLQGQGWALGDTGSEFVEVNDAMEALGMAQEEVQAQEDVSDPGRLTNKEAFDRGEITQANRYTDQEYSSFVQGIKDKYNLNEASSLLLDSLEFEDFGSKQYTQRELSTLVENSIADAEASLSPFYNELKDKELADLKSDFEKIRADAAGYKAQESMDYASTLKATQKNLADRGLTFSGIARQELGDKSAIGGEGVKGRLNEARDLAYESRMEGFKDRGQTLGRAGEKYFGTETVKDLDTSIPDRESTYGGYKSISNIEAAKSRFGQDRTLNIADRAAFNLSRKPTTSTLTDWGTAYKGRFSHLKNNPNRARQLADKYDAAGKDKNAIGSWRGTK